jgi:hypothetical protein
MRIKMLLACLGIVLLTALLVANQTTAISPKAGKVIPPQVEDPATKNNVGPGECDCIVDQVAFMGNRVHVHCQARNPDVTHIAPSPFPYFALPLNSPYANLFMIMGTEVAMENRRGYQLRSFCAMPDSGGMIGCKGDTGTTNGILVNPLNPSTLHIWYDENDKSGASFGCLESDCRIPQMFAILG